MPTLESPLKKLDVFNMPDTLSQAKEQIRQAELMYDGVVASLGCNEKRAHAQQRELDGIYEANEEAALDEYDAAQDEPDVLKKDVIILTEKSIKWISAYKTEPIFGWKFRIEVLKGKCYVRADKEELRLTLNTRGLPLKEAQALCLDFMRAVVSRDA